MGSLIFLNPAKCFAASNQRLAKRYLLTLQYTISGNIADSASFVCQYGLRQTRAGGNSYFFRSVDCGGHESTVIIKKTGSSIFATIPVDVVSTLTDGINVVQIRKEVDLSCSGSGSKSFLSGTCSGSSNQNGIRFIFSGSFNAASVGSNRTIELRKRLD
jgi:hypothetical protein